MEERVPPASDTKRASGKTPPPPPPSSGHGMPETHVILRSGTYVVQVPKDQIYRVPPPENAEYLERYHRRNQTETKRSKCSCLLFPFLVLFLFVLVILILIGISYIIMKPKNPNFSVQNIVVATSHHLQEYTFTLKATNPNERMGVHSLKGGHASLNFKQHTISTGISPAFSTETQSSTRVRLELSGSKTTLPSELQKIMEGKGKKKQRIALSLLVNFPVKMEIGLLTTWGMKMVVTCDLMVNTLGKGTRVLSQTCQTKIQVF